MEQALYHPEHGYYSSGRASIGRQGDYFTNVSVGPLFGQLLAAQFEQMWQVLGSIDNFTIVEQGAHGGEFARDVLSAIRATSPPFFAALRYRIVEPFRLWQDRQRQTLDEFRDRVEWRDSLDRLEPFAGVHFSNELLDAMPVRLLAPASSVALQEKLVALQDDELVFIEEPSNETERSPAIFSWIDNLSVKLLRGFVLIIDYGFAREEFREAVQVRAQHRLLDSPFEQIGEADITAHINWTEIAERAGANGLRVSGFTDQHHFLTGLITEFPAIVAPEKSKRALQTLLHPEMLGRAFQVLALNKEVDSAAPLAGFKFARDSRRVLGN
jgi:SAM-dependent MidA family methyltransferase